MIAVQFTTTMHKNTIKVPKSFKGFNENTVQVIIMKEDRAPTGIEKFAGKIHLREDPLYYQRRRRREWK